MKQIATNNAPAAIGTLPQASSHRAALKSSPAKV